MSRKLYYLNKFYKIQTNHIKFQEKDLFKLNEIC